MPTIGQLRSQVIPQRRYTVKDSYGQDVVSYANLLTGDGKVWAEVVDGAGVEVERARRVVAEASAVITIRWMRVLETTARFTFGSRTLEVVDVGNEGQRNQWLVCACKELAS